MNFRHLQKLSVLSKLQPITRSIQKSLNGHRTYPRLSSRAGHSTQCAAGSSRRKALASRQSSGQCSSNGRACFSSFTRRPHLPGTRSTLFVTKNVSKVIRNYRGNTRNVLAFRIKSVRSFARKETKTISNEEIEKEKERRKFTQELKLKQAISSFIRHSRKHSALNSSFGGSGSGSFFIANRTPMVLKHSKPIKQLKAPTNANPQNNQRRCFSTKRPVTPFKNTKENKKISSPGTSHDDQRLELPYFYRQVELKDEIIHKMQRTYFHFPDKVSASYWPIPVQKSLSSKPFNQSQKSSSLNLEQVKENIAKTMEKISKSKYLKSFKEGNQVFQNQHKMRSTSATSNIHKELIYNATNRRRISTKTGDTNNLIETKSNKEENKKQDTFKFEKSVSSQTRKESNKSDQKKEQSPRRATLILTPVQKSRTETKTNLNETADKLTFLSKSIYNLKESESSKILENSNNENNTLASYKPSFKLYSCKMMVDKQFTDPSETIETINKMLATAEKENPSKPRLKITLIPKDPYQRFDNSVLNKPVLEEKPKVKNTNKQIELDNIPLTFSIGAKRLEEKIENTDFLSNKSNFEKESLQEASLENELKRTKSSFDVFSTKWENVKTTKPILDTYAQLPKKMDSILNQDKENPSNHGGNKITPFYGPSSEEFSRKIQKETRKDDNNKPLKFKFTTLMKGKINKNETLKLDLFETSIAKKEFNEAMNRTFKDTKSICYIFNCKKNQSIETVKKTASKILKSVSLTTVCRKNGVYESQVLNSESFKKSNSMSKLTSSADVNEKLSFTAENSYNLPMKKKEILHEPSLEYILKVSERSKKISPKINQFFCNAEGKTANIKKTNTSSSLEEKFDLDKNLDNFVESAIKKVSKTTLKAPTIYPKKLNFSKYIEIAQNSSNVNKNLIDEKLITKLTDFKFPNLSTTDNSIKKNLNTKSSSKKMGNAVSEPKKVMSILDLMWSEVQVQAKKTFKNMELESQKNTEEKKKPVVETLFVNKSITKKPIVTKTIAEKPNITKPNIEKSVANKANHVVKNNKNNIKLSIEAIKGKSVPISNLKFPKPMIMKDMKELSEGNLHIKSLANIINDNPTNVFKSSFISPATLKNNLITHPRQVRSDPKLDTAHVTKKQSGTSYFSSVNKPNSLSRYKSDCCNKKPEIPCKRSLERLDLRQRMRETDCIKKEKEFFRKEENTSVDEVIELVNYEPKMRPFEKPSYLKDCVKVKTNPCKRKSICGKNEKCSKRIPCFKAAKKPKKRTSSCKPVKKKKKLTKKSKSCSNSASKNSVIYCEPPKKANMGKKSEPTSKTVVTCSQLPKKLDIRTICNSKSKSTCSEPPKEQNCNLCDPPKCGKKKTPRGPQLVPPKCKDGQCKAPTVTCKKATTKPPKSCKRESRGRCCKKKDICGESTTCCKPPKKKEIGPVCKTKSCESTCKTQSPCKKQSKSKCAQSPCKKQSKCKQNLCEKQSKCKQDPCKKRSKSKCKQDPCKKPSKCKQNICQKQSKCKQDPCKKPSKCKQDPCKKPSKCKLDPCKKPSKSKCKKSSRNICADDKCGKPPKSICEETPKNICADDECKKSKNVCGKSSKSVCKKRSKSVCKKQSKKSVCKKESVCKKPSKSVCKKESASSTKKIKIFICNADKGKSKKKPESVCKKPSKDLSKKRSKSTCKKSSKDACKKRSKSTCKKPSKDVCKKPSKSSCQKVVCKKPSKSTCKPSKDTCKKRSKSVCKKPSKSSCKPPKPSKSSCQKVVCKKPSKSTCKPSKDTCKKRSKSVCKKPSKSSCKPPKPSKSSCQKVVCKKPSKSTCKPSKDTCKKRSKSVCKKPSKSSCKPPKPSKSSCQKVVCKKPSKSTCKPSKDTCKKRSKSVCKKPSKSSCKPPKPSKSSCQKVVCKKPSKNLCKKRSKSACKKPSKDTCKKRSKSVCKKPSKSSCKPPKVVCKKPSKDVCKCVCKPSKDVCKKPSKSVCKKPSKNVCKKRSKSVCKKPSKSACKKRSKSVCKKPSKSICKKPSKSKCQPADPCKRLPKDYFNTVCNPKKKTEQVAENKDSFNNICKQSLAKKSQPKVCSMKKGVRKCEKPKKADPCKKKSKKNICSKKPDPCKKKSKPCKVKTDPCKKKKRVPCKKSKKKPSVCCEKPDPCKKKADPCKKKSKSSCCNLKPTPCKLKTDPCKKKKSPCKLSKKKPKPSVCCEKPDPCKKKPDPCKKKSKPSVCCKKPDPCKKKPDPCKKKSKLSICDEKPDPCKKKASPCKKKPKRTSCTVKTNPCKKKKVSPCKKTKKKPSVCCETPDPCKKKGTNPCKVNAPAKKKTLTCKKKEDPCKKSDNKFCKSPTSKNKIKSKPADPCVIPKNKKKEMGSQKSSKCKKAVKCESSTAASSCKKDSKSSIESKNRLPCNVPYRKKETKPDRKWLAKNIPCPSQCKIPVPICPKPKGSKCKNDGPCKEIVIKRKLKTDPKENNKGKKPPPSAQASGSGGFPPPKYAPPANKSTTSLQFVKKTLPEAPDLTKVVKCRSDPNMYSRRDVCKCEKFTPVQMYRLARYVPKKSSCNKDYFNQVCKTSSGCKPKQDPCSGKDKFNKLCKSKSKNQPSFKPYSCNDTSSCSKGYKAAKVSPDYQNKIEEMIEDKKVVAKTEMKNLPILPQKSKDDIPPYIKILEQLQEEDSLNILTKKRKK